MVKSSLTVSLFCVASSAAFAPSSLKPRSTMLDFIEEDEYIFVQDPFVPVRNGAWWADSLFQRSADCALEQECDIDEIYALVDGKFRVDTEND